MQTTNEEKQTDLLQFEISLVRATSGKRFLNYLIDLIIFYILIFSIGFVWALVSPETIDSLQSNTGFQLLDRIFGLLLYATYMSSVEAVFKGKSLGKLITGTRAVNMDGSKISTATAFARGFSRAVPFCAFSALGSPSNPWQDRWTNTMVIDEKQSSL